MQAIISDSGPLRYIIMIEAEFLLRDFFEKVLVPKAVIAELSHASTPEKVRKFIADLPVWISVQEATHKINNPRLGPGESEAIALALERNLMLLADDLPARKCAHDLGIKTLGTLGIIEAAAVRKIIDFEEYYGRLAGLGFYVSEALLQEIRGRISK